MKAPRTGRARGPAIKQVVAGAYIGTAEIVAAVVKDSVGPVGWRPVRAAAAMAMGATGKGNVWMTVEEFRAWEATHFDRPGPKSVGAAIGMKGSRRHDILKGVRITKIEALACAHFGAGLPAPVEPGDFEGFSTYVAERFGSVSGLTRALGVAPAYIPDRMRGYGLREHRVPRLPALDDIRAIDWVWRVGPFSPYGDRVGGRPFPTKES